MRIGHIIGGLVVFSLGLFLAYLNSAVVVVFFKGAVQPATILLGFVALIAALLGRVEFRTINSILAGVFLIVGFYGLYDEYYAVLDFCYGFLPFFLLITGVVSLTYGIKKLK